MAIQPRGVLVSGAGSLVASQVVSLGPTQLFELGCTNTSGGTLYCQIFNSASVPADSTTPDVVFAVPGTSSVSWDPQEGINFSAGISVCLSSTAHTKTIAGSVGVFFAVVQA